ncbi:MAG TPA: LytTR family DNA-binding domain-containing protein, partial [Gemmatimonadaceae bacterium]
YDIAILVASHELDVWQIIDDTGDSLPTTIVVAESEAGAARAFDLQLADYIVGPASCERFARAIDHAVARIDRAGDKEVFARLHSLLSSIKESSNRPSRFLVNDKRKYSFIQAADIDWVEAADNYVILHVGEKQYFVRDTMSSMESRLEGERFMRIHRSAIINVDSVKSIEPWSGTEFRFVLNDGTTLISGRRYRERLRSVLLRG